MLRDHLVRDRRGNIVRNKALDDLDALALQTAGVAVFLFDGQILPGDVDHQL